MKVVSNTAVSLDGRINTRERRFAFFGSERDHACMSRLREVEWYTEALLALGFHDIQVIPGGVDLVTAVAI